MYQSTISGELPTPTSCTLPSEFSSSEALSWPAHRTPWSRPMITGCPDLYDHRLRDLVRRTGKVTLATSRGVPRSTAAGWLRQSDRTTVTIDVLSKNEQNLQAEVTRLRRRIQNLRTVVRLLVALLRAFDVDLARRRLPDGEAKSGLLRAIERAQPAVKLRTVLRVLGLSLSRFHAWKRAETGCDLYDHSSCPRVSPHQLTLDEIQTIREMVTSSEYRHVSTGRLAILAQRRGRVFASPTTWHRLVRERGWRRPRLRLHPAKPKVGIRASRPNEMWHIDTTVIRRMRAGLGLRDRRNSRDPDLSAQASASTVGVRNPSLQLKAQRDHGWHGPEQSAGKYSNEISSTTPSPSTSKTKKRWQ